MIKIKYRDEELNIASGNLKKCQLGQLLGKITLEFKIKIETIFHDDKRNITITNREYRKEEQVDSKGRKSISSRKWYKYTCNICGWTEGWIEENHLIGKKQTGCSCCCPTPRIVVEGINDIPTTAPWMIKYFQGGYDEAKLYTKSSGSSIFPLCPDCGRVKKEKVSIFNIYKNNSIGCSCSDFIPYGEKLMYSVLEQLNIDFKIQLNKTTFNWCKNYKYDFYFEYNNESYIIETHGVQHYEEKTINSKFKTLKKEQLNDKLKKELALANGIKPENYIIIDCRKSTLDWIVNNENGISNSKLNELFDLSMINWIKVEEYACSNLVKVACDYKQNNPNLTTTEIGRIMNLNFSTIINWLKLGVKLGWCDYDAKEEMRKSGFILGKSSGKPVEIFKDEVSLGIFESVSELERKSEELFGIKFNFGNISSVCRNKTKQYKGYHFKYVSDLTEEQIQYN